MRFAKGCNVLRGEVLKIKEHFERIDRIHFSENGEIYRWRPNGPELSCGNEVPQRRNPVRASQVMSNSNW
ncbi:MAG: hypothetical protein WBZ48_03630, partial [Bacteroidota bacterium]